MFTTDPEPPASSHESAAHSLTLLEVAGLFAVCKLPPDSAVPAWATAGDVFSVTRTADELSVVCRQEMVPAGTHCEGGWRCLRVAGAMPFTLVGVLASLTSAGGGRPGVGVFAVLDVRHRLPAREGRADSREAVAALRAAGHSVEGVLP